MPNKPTIQKVIVKFPCDLDPMDRYQRYHLPLDAALWGQGLGHVTGGGTMECLDTGRVLYSDVQVDISGDLDQALGVIRAVLGRCDAPPGTEMCIEGTEIVLRVGLH